MVQTDREYAEALFSLAKEENASELYLNSLNTLKQLLQETPEYIEFLASPAIPLSERTDAIDKAFAETMPEYIVSFIKLLCESGKIRTVFSCIEEFCRLACAFSNRATANIYSTVALNDIQKSNICKKLENLTGKIIDPIYIIDESLIGGIKIEVDGKIFDGSIKHRLGRIKDVMNS